MTKNNVKNGFAKEGGAALAHAVMISSNEDDIIVLAAPTPEALERAFKALIGSTFNRSSIQHVAICDAAMANLMMEPGKEFS